MTSVLKVWLVFRLATTQFEDLLHFAIYATISKLVYEGRRFVNCKHSH